MSEERENYALKGRWLAYDKKLFSQYRIQAPMRERTSHESIDFPLGLIIEGPNGKIELSIDEARVFERHIQAALTAVERVLASQMEVYEERMREAY